MKQFVIALLMVFAVTSCEESGDIEDITITKGQVKQSESTNSQVPGANDNLPPE